MNSTFKSIILTATVCVALGLAASAAGPAAAAEASPATSSVAAIVHRAGDSNELERLIVANQTGRSLDMTITLADGGTIHQVVSANSGWYPDGDYTRDATITVRDEQGVAFTGVFRYNGDWVAGKVTTTPRLRYQWHTGPFGGYDFR